MTECEKLAFFNKIPQERPIYRRIFTSLQYMLQRQERLAVLIELQKYPFWLLKRREVSFEPNVLKTFCATQTYTNTCNVLAEQCFCHLEILQYL